MGIAFEAINVTILVFHYRQKLLPQEMWRQGYLSPVRFCLLGVLYLSSRGHVAQRRRTFNSR